MKHSNIAFLWISCFLMSLSVWASEGILDTTFNSPDGYVLWDGGSGYDRGRDIALQQDGKILVTGYMTNGTDNDIMVIRYTTDGTLDTGFGTNGAYIYDGGQGNDGGYAIAVQSDNKILVAGDSLNDTDSDVIVLRLDADGNLDPNFGSNGIYSYDGNNGSDSAIDLLVQSDGKILMCGSSSNETDNDLLVIRLNVNGAPDTTFGANGVVIYDRVNSHDFGTRLTVQDDGKILVTGSSHNGSDSDIIIARFNIGGTLDVSFGTSGIAIYDGGDYDQGHGIDTDSSGNILVTGLLTKPDPNCTDYDIPVLRFDPNGLLDTSFGNNGIVLFDGGTHEECFDLVVQSDDTILITGHSGISVGSVSDWGLVVLKYDPNGTLDTTFGTNGIYQYDPTDNTERGYGLALQPDGRIVVAGQVYNGTDEDVIVLRLTNSAGDSNEPNEPGIESGHLQWSQPPLLIGYDTDSNAFKSFCGGYAPSKSVVSETERRTWQIVADDFHCSGSMPVTRIQWWGSYKAWTQTEPPELQPDIWHIGFWGHEPDDFEEPSYVQVLVHEFDITADRVKRIPVGLNTLAANGPETLFQYDVTLEPYERFHCSEIPSKDDVFWISIVAVYPEGVSGQNHWGWSTRPAPWREPAQNFVLYDDGPTPDVTLWSGMLNPIINDSFCEQSRGFDMAFELLTDSAWIYCEQSFMTVEDWPRVGDQISMLAAPDDPMIEREVADDWLCEQPGPITAVSWYGSYIDYVNEACVCNQGPYPSRPDFFILSIFENADPNQAMPYDHPGEKIWEFKTDEFEEVLVGSEWQPEGEPNEAVFRYTARLPEPDWFICDGTVRTLWLSVMAVYEESLDAIPYSWGWTTRDHEFGDGAKWKDISAHMSMSPIWWPARDSADQDVDMCFTLYTMPVPPGPIALWPLDETSGDIVHDIDNRHNGMLYNGTWTEGRINGALEFNGLNTYVDMGDSNLLAPDEMTFALWIRPEHMGGARYVASRAHTSDLTDYAVLCHLAGQIEFVFDERGSGPGSIFSQTQLALGEWAHMAVTREPAQAVIYINGQKEGANSCSNRSTGEGFKLTISSRRGQTRFFNGRIDEIHLYDLILSEEEIIQLAEVPE